MATSTTFCSPTTKDRKFSSMLASCFMNPHWACCHFKPIKHIFRERIKNGKSWVTHSLAPPSCKPALRNNATAVSRSKVERNLANNIKQQALELLWLHVCPLLAWAIEGFQLVVQTLCCCFECLQGLQASNHHSFHHRMSCIFMLPSIFANALSHYRSNVPLWIQSLISINLWYLC